MTTIRFVPPVTDDDMAAAVQAARAMEALPEPQPSAVTDVFDFIDRQPPGRSARCEWWVQRISLGESPDWEIRTSWCAEAAERLGVWVWEYVNVIYPLIKEEQP